MYKIAIFLIALLLAPSICIRHSQSSIKASQAALQKIKNQKGTWASFLVNLAEVHSMTGGPFDELFDAINEVIEDLNKKLNKAHEDYQKRTELHESEVLRIQGLIDSASSDIAATTEYIQVLQLQLQSLQTDIVNIEQGLEENEQNREASILLRESQHQEFVKQVPEHEEAIAAIDEALEVLSQLLEGGEVSLVQVKSLRKNFDSIKNKLKSGKDSSILKALMQVAVDSKFADQSAIQQVAQLMRDVRSNLTESLLFIQEQEATQAAQHQLDLQEFDNKQAQLQTELTETQEFIAQTEQFIVDSQEFLAIRTKDKAQSEQDLEDEHTSFDIATKNYEELVAQFNAELQGCQAALDHLNGAEFADYIGDRMGQEDWEIQSGAAHGQGIIVEEKFDEFQ